MYSCTFFLSFVGVPLALYLDFVRTFVEIMMSVLVRKQKGQNLISFLECYLRLTSMDLQLNSSTCTPLYVHLEGDLDVTLAFLNVICASHL